MKRHLIDLEVAVAFVAGMVFKRREKVYDSVGGKLLHPIRTGRPIHQHVRPICVSADELDELS